MARPAVANANGGKPFFADLGCREPKHGPDGLHAESQWVSPPRVPEERARRVPSKARKQTASCSDFIRVTARFAGSYSMEAGQNHVDGVPVAKNRPQAA